MSTPEPTPEITPPEVTPESVPLVTPKPRVWTVFATFATTVVVMLVLAVAVILAALVIMGFEMESAMSSPLVLFGLMLGSFFATAGAALGGAWLSPTPWRQRLRLLVVPMSAPGLIIGTLGVLGIGMAVDALDGLGLVPASPTLEFIAVALNNLGPLSLAVATVAIGLLPGIAEELLFRGYIQTRLCARWGTKRGILYTSLLFGLIHFDLVQGTYAVIVGLFLGYMTERYGSILPAMIAHAINNSASGMLSGHLNGPLASGVGLAVAVGVTGASLLYLRERVNNGTAIS